MYDYWQSKFVKLALLNWDEKHRGGSAHKVRSEQFHVNKLSMSSLESATMEKLDSANQLVLAESVVREFQRSISSLQCLFLWTES